MRIGLEHVNKARDALTSLIVRARDIHESLGTDPEADSVADQDRRANQKVAGTLLEQGDLLLTQVADHAIGFRELVRVEHTRALAPSVMARAVLENAAMVLWLLDVNVDAITRFGRSLTWQRKDLNEEKKLTRSLIKHHREEMNKALAENPSFEISPMESMIEARESELKDAEEKIGELETLAGTHDLGQIPGFQGFTNIVGRVKNWEVHYRMLSGLIHGNSSRLKSIGYRVVQGQQTPSGVVLERRVDPVVLVYLCDVVAEAFILAVGARHEYFGFDLDGLKEQVRRPLDVIGRLRIRMKEAGDALSES